MPHVGRPHVPGAGRAGHRSPSPARKRVVYFHGCGANYYEPRLGERPSPSSSTTASGSTSPAGLLRAAAAVQRHLRRRARATCGGSRAHLRADARDGRHDIVGTSTSCSLMLKREARGDPRAGGDAGPRVPSARASYDIVRVPAATARARRAAHRLRAGRHDGHLPRALPAAGPRHRQAGARPDGARARACASSRTTRPAAAWPGRTASSARSTTIAMEVG